MFKLINIELFPIKVTGHKYTAFAIGTLGPGSSTASPQPPSKLSVPWRKEAQKEPLLSYLLNWRSAVSDFKGRDAEMKALSQWAMSDPSISMKFITGDGGSGKTRLAAEFATELQRKKWEAGFVRLDKIQSFPMAKKGTLLVIDYPEENRKAVEKLFLDLAALGPAEGPVRVLLLTRQGYERWYDVILDNHADGILDPVPIRLTRFPDPSAYEVFDSVQCKASEYYDVDILPLSEEALIDWLQQSEENKRPLFIVALALNSVLSPEEEIVRYSGPGVIKLLVDRELSRLRRFAKHHGFTDQYTIARILAMASIADSLHITNIKELTKNPDLEMNIPAGTDIESILNESQYLTDRSIQAIKPDIVAAAFTVEVFKQKPETAPELIWVTLEPDLSGGLERLARLSYDAEIVLGIIEDRISKWLENAVNNHLKRCEILKNFIWESDLPIGLIDAAVSVLQTLLNNVTDYITKGPLLNLLYIRLGDKGDKAGSLKAIQEAVDIYRRLSEEIPGFEHDLGTCLSNLSVSLGDKGDKAGSLKAIQEAVDIYRRLSEENPARFESVLGACLSNLSDSLGDIDDKAGSLKAIQEAVDIYRRLSEEDSAFESKLAFFLSNLSGRLNEVGNNEDSLDVSREAVDIYRRLSEEDPARFEPDLARCLNNLSSGLIFKGDRVGSLKVSQEAVSIYRLFSEVNPARFEPDLAISLSLLSLRLLYVGENEDSLDVIREAVDIYRRLSEEAPARFEPELARCLGTLGAIYRENGQVPDALNAFSEGVEFIKPYADQWPNSSYSKRKRGLEKDLEEVRTLMKEK